MPSEEPRLYPTMFSNFHQSPMVKYMLKLEKYSSRSFPFLLFLFYTGRGLITNVSGVKQSDAVVQVSILFQILSPLGYYRILSRVPCVMVGPCWLSVLNIAVYICQSHTQNLSLPCSNSKCVLKSVSLFLFCK